MCRPEKRGTCWQECVCDYSANCRFQEGCADFTCDSARLRRKGQTDECVQDQCTGVGPPCLIQPRLHTQKPSMTRGQDEDLDSRSFF